MVSFSKNYPLVSIVIPNFNNAPYLQDCLLSILGQSYRNMEIIIIDDCSSDSSIRIIEEALRQDDRICLIRNSKNLGVSATKNIGLRKARGEFITTLDSDDVYLSSEKISSEVEALKNYGPQYVSYSGVVWIDVHGKKIKEYISTNRKKEGDIFEGILTRSVPIPRDFMFDRCVIEQVGLFNESLVRYEDWDFKIRVSSVCKFVYAADEGIGYRKHDEGLSSVSRKNQLETMRRVFETHVPKREHHRLFKRYRASVMRWSPGWVINKVNGIFR